MYLRQSTARVVPFGPFVSPTDGGTLVSTLISALDHATTGIKLSKNGGAFAVRHATVTASTYDGGDYLVTLDTTDTATLGHMRMKFYDVTTNLPVWIDFQVITATAWDALMATSGGAGGLIIPAGQLGDIPLSGVLDFDFYSVATLSGTPKVRVYKSNSTTESSDFTPTVDFDSRSGMNHVQIDTSSDPTFFATGNDFAVAITAGTVGGTSVVGVPVAHFSINNRSALRPTTTGRTLDVSSGGEAGLDWANVGSPTTTVVFSGTTIGVITAYTGNTPQTGDSFAIVNHATYGNAKLVRATTPANTLAVDVNHRVDVGAVNGSTNAAINLANLYFVDVAGDSGEPTRTVVGSNIFAHQQGTDVFTWLVPAQFFFDYLNYDSGDETFFPDFATLKDAYTTARAAKLDNLDATVSSRLAPAGTLATVMNLTNAPTAGDFTATMKASITTAATAATPTVTLAATQALYTPATATALAAVSSKIGTPAGASLAADVAAKPTAAQIDTQLSGTHGSGAWGASGAGAGAYTVVVHVTDGTSALQNALVRLTLNSDTYTATTNASGNATFNLDAGTYVRAATLAGYQFGGDSVVVTGSATLSTVVMTLTSHATPAANQCTGLLVTVDEHGAPEAGITIEFQVLGAPVPSSARAFKRATWTAESDGGGAIAETFAAGAVLYRGRRMNADESWGPWVEFRTADDEGDDFALPDLLGGPE